MGILSSRRKLHIHSNKDWISPQVIDFLPNEAIKLLYFPLVSPRGTPAEQFVQVGDFVKIGTKLGVHKDWYVPFYSSVSGKVIAVEDRFHAGLQRAVKHLVIENDYKETYEAPLKTVSNLSSPAEIVDAIKEAGIVGQGGAGFPTFMKYGGVTGISDILINGVECEPYLMTDYNAVKEKTRLLVAGVELFLKASGARLARIAIKENKTELIATVEKALKGRPDIVVTRVPDEYPMGYERTLIQEVYKRDYNVLPKEVGIIVNNTQTAIAVAEVLLDGKFFTHHYFTVAGDGINRNKIFYLPNGVAVNEIIKVAGGYTSQDITLLAGGPMTSRGLGNDTFAVLPANGGLTILKRHEYQQVECLRCGTCSRYCPLSLYPVEIMKAGEGKNENRLRKLEASRCSECGICSYVCPSHVDVTESIKKAKLFLRIQDQKKANQGGK